jgi:RNA polymerase sigma factor (sigma-70 family)
MANAELHSYMQEVGKYPILCEEAQLLHCRRIHEWMHPLSYHEQTVSKQTVERRGRHSMKAMVNTNLRMVVSIAKKFQHKGLEFSDLIQEGNIGLVRGLELYDPARGYRISTYAYWWIRQGITRALHNQGRTIRLPIGHYETLNKVQRYSQEMQSRTGRKPTLEELAAYAKISPERMLLIGQVYAMTEVTSLNRPGIEGGSNLIELIPAVDSPEDDGFSFAPPFPFASPSVSPGEAPVLALPSAEHRMISAAMRRLPEKERYVLEEIVVKEKGLQEVASDMQLSKSRIGQLLKSGRDSLRVEMERLQG